MFDIGWQELFLIALVTIIVVGPKELPRVLRTITMAVRKIRGMASDFQSSLDEIARESELAEIRRDLEKSVDVDLQNELEGAIDPTGEISGSMKELESSMSATGEETDVEASTVDRGSDQPRSAQAVEAPEDAKPPARSGMSG